jgi:hypothetical protein
VDWVVGQPNAGSYDTKGLIIIKGKKEFTGQTPLARQSTERTCTSHASAKLIIISITLQQSGGQTMSTSIKEIN